ncbi:MAG: hypothetical protein IKX46_07135, partial [Verrucomicrobia bacterium]|nr:hypothetical protein [Verrucomicrobiota bacterium]
MKIWDVRTNDIQSVLFNAFPEETLRNKAFLLEKKGDTYTWTATGLSANSLSGEQTYQTDPQVVNGILQDLAKTEVLD